MAWFLVFIFIFGLCLGSFLNVLIYRLPQNLSIAGRSFCPKCQKKISWYDNIPILSFILLRAKCRFCRSPISWYYPVVELTMGILFLIAFNFQFSIFNFQSNPNFQFSKIFDIGSISIYLKLIFILYILSSLVVIFFTDLKYGIIPDKVLYPTILISVLYILLNTNYLMLPYLLSAIGAFLFFFILMVGTELILKKEGMGFGDVKLAFFMGLLLGFPKIVIALYVAFLTGALVSFILIILKKKKFFGGMIPFGPFLVFGTMVAIFFGELILKYALIYVFKP